MLTDSRHRPLPLTFAVNMSVKARSKPPLSDNPRRGR